jgi:phosphopantetheine adenylyltransferase
MDDYKYERLVREINERLIPEANQNFLRTDANFDKAARMFDQIRVVIRELHAQVCALEDKVIRLERSR